MGGDILIMWGYGIVPNKIDHVTSLSDATSLIQAQAWLAFCLPSIYEALTSSGYVRGSSSSVLL